MARSDRLAVSCVRAPLATPALLRLCPRAASASPATPATSSATFPSMPRAAVMPGPRKAIEVRDFPDPVLEPGSMLLDTIASEVCGTDVHLHHGRLAGVPYPIIPGHVSVGRIADLRGITRDALGAPLAAGDAVTFYDVHGTCG